MFGGLWSDESLPSLFRATRLPCASGAMGFLGRCIESFGAEVVLSIGSNLASKGYTLPETNIAPENGWFED